MHFFKTITFPDGSSHETTLELDKQEAWEMATELFNLNPTAYKIESKDDADGNYMVSVRAKDRILLQLQTEYYYLLSKAMRRMNRKSQPKPYNYDI